MEASSQPYVPAPLPTYKQPGGTHRITGWVSLTASMTFWRRRKSVAPAAIPTPKRPDRKLNTVLSNVGSNVETLTQIYPRLFPTQFSIHFSSIIRSPLVTQA